MKAEQVDESIKKPKDDEKLTEDDDGQQEDINELETNRKFMSDEKGEMSPGKVFQEMDNNARDVSLTIKATL